MIAARTARNLRRAGTEPEAAAGPVAGAAADLGLCVVEPLIIDVRARPDIVVALQPVAVQHRLILVVVPVIRHERVDGAEIGVGVEIEERRSAFIRP